MTYFIVVKKIELILIFFRLRSTDLRLWFHFPAKSRRGLRLYQCIARRLGKSVEA